MSTSSGVSSSSCLHDSIRLAAIPLAASAVVLLARVLPVRFEYRPNDLGIVSATTLARYPQQQELFWFVFALVAGSAIALAFTSAFAGRAFTRGRGLAMEIAGAMSLASLLFMPRGYAEAVSLLSMAVCGVLAARALRTPEGTLPIPAAPALAAVSWRWLAAFALLALLLTPGLPGSMVLFLARAPDSVFAANTWLFQGEVGARLAWGDRFLHGQEQGRDFFCLYGPLGNWILVALWKAFGRSIAAWYAYSGALNALGFLGMMILGACLVRRRALALLLPFLTQDVQLIHDVRLRLGFGFLGLACLMAWIRSRRPAWCVAAGAIAGASILYSQEYGIAFALTVGVALLLRRDIRAAGLFALGVAFALAPVLAWQARAGALGPMLRDLAQYPAYVVAGFGKQPFPALLPHLPLRSSYLDLYPEGLVLRIGYSSPPILASALLLALPVAAPGIRRPLAWARAAREALASDPWRLGVVITALYGLLSFRTALGRSDFPHIAGVMAVPAILLVVGLDRAAARLRETPLSAAWRMAALVLAAWIGGFVSAAPITALRANLADASFFLSGGRPSGDPEVNSVATWVREHSTPADPVMFVPGDAAYYYLADRRNPTRFDLSHLMVTDAHRAEALADMRARPPRWIAWDEGAWRVDGIPDSILFGSEMLAWIDGHYEEKARIGSVRFLGRRR